MPTLTIKGKDVQVGDDFMSLPQDQRDKTIDEIASKIPDEQTGLMATVKDVAKAVPRGLAKGAIDLAGAPGNISNLVGAGVEKAGEFLGAAPRAVPELGGLPSSRDIQGQVEKVTGPLGEAQTRPGQYVESVAEYAPSAFIGPGGLATKAATTVAGGVGTEAGRELGGETGAFIGGLAGGVAGGIGAAETAERALGRALPGDAENYRASRAAFKMIEQAGVKINPMVTNTFVDTLKDDLENGHFITPAGVAGGIFNQLDKVKDGDLAHLMDLHSKLGKVSPRRGEAYEAALIVRPRIRDFIENLQDSQLLSGAPGGAQYVSALWKDARDKWRVHAKLTEVSQAAEAADTRRLATGRGMNWNTFRQEFKKILLSDDKTRGYSDEAVDKIENIVKGTLVQNTARVGSAMAPQRGVLGAAPAALALAAGGIEPAGIVASIGEISHLLEGYLTRRQIKQLEDLIKRESPLAPQQTLPNRAAIAPAAAVRSGLATGGGSPLANQYP